MGERRTSCPLPRNSRLSGVAALGSLVLLLAVVLGGANIGTSFNLKSPRAGTTSMVIPFFGSHGDDDDDKSTRWSQLNHRVEEYRQDLVKVVEVSTQRTALHLRIRLFSLVSPTRSCRQFARHGSEASEADLMANSPTCLARRDVLVCLYIDRLCKAHNKLTSSEVFSQVKKE